jgi:hypothetical protein
LLAAKPDSVIAIETVLVVVFYKLFRREIGFVLRQQRCYGVLKHKQEASFVKPPALRV